MSELASLIRIPFAAIPAGRWALAALVSWCLGGGAACSDEACSLQSDCPSDQICTSAGDCVPRTQGGTRGGDLGLDLGVGASDAASPDASDTGPADVGLPDGGSFDMGSPDSGTGDTGGADAGAGDGGVPAASDRAFVRARQFAGDVIVGTRLEGLLQDRSGAQYQVFERTFMLPTSGACVLREEQLSSGTPVRYFVRELRISVDEVPRVSNVLVGDALGRYAPMLPPGRALLRPNVDVLFEMVGASTGDPSPGLEGLDPERVATPTGLAGLTPDPSLALDLNLSNDFRWVQSGVAGARVVFEAVSRPDGELSLRCEVDDTGIFTLPAEAGRAFIARRGTRAVELLAYRFNRRVVSADRVGGGTLDIDLQVHVGARYDLR